MWLTADISAGIWVLLIGMAVIVAALFLVPQRLNEFFNERRWVLPAIAFLLMVGVTVEARGFVHALHTDEVTSCERNNESRAASVEEKRQSVKTLRKTLRLWRAALKESPPPERADSPILPLFLAYVESLEEELDTKRVGIHDAIAAQAEVAIEPGSPVVDCAKAFG